MPAMGAHQAWVIAGPTAVGKSAVAHALAIERGAAILSADAMAVYRGLDIGTAKPPAAWLAEVPYYGLNLVDPDQPFSVEAFLKAARRAVSETEAAGRLLIVVGGTGLYLSALLRGLDAGPPPDPAVRARWERVLAEEGVAGLQAALRARDAHAYARLADPQNPRRLIRALERAETGAVPPARWREAAPRPIVVLFLEPDVLRRRIAERARAMFERGLLDEAARIRNRWPVLSPTASQAIGYAEAFDVLDGRRSIDEAIQRTAARTWQLARRQMTWFRHQLSVSWIDGTNVQSTAEWVNAVRRQWEQDGPSLLHL